MTGAVGTIDYWPRYSPDGRTILFTRCAGDPTCSEAPPAGPYALYTIPASGGAASALFTPPAGNAATRPDWAWNPSLASRQIAFAYTGVTETSSQLWLVNQDGSSPTAVGADVTGASYPSFYPNGASVWVEVPGRPGPSSATIALPGGNVLSTFNALWTGESMVSRDGTMVAMAAQTPVSGGTYDDTKNSIWVANIDGSNLHVLDGLQGRTPNWSPHGTLLEFESTRGCATTTKNYSIFVEPATGGTAVQITDCSYTANHAVWSPDGRTFAVAIQLPGSKALKPGGYWGIAILSVPAALRP